MVKVNFNIMKNSLIKNSIVLFTGQTMSSIVYMIISIIVVREIGFDKYGVITLGLTYINIFNILLNFQSFNAVIKYGHEAIAKDDKQLLKSYLKQAFLQDLITAILAYIISLIFLNKIVGFFHWNNYIKTTIIILSFSTLFNITGSVVGLIRLFNKFNYISTMTIITALIKLCLVFVGVCLNFGFLYYVFIELIASVLSNILNGLVGVVILKDNKLLDFLCVKDKWNKSFLKFNVYNNLVSTLDLPVGEFTKIFISQFLGVSELGVYNILVKVGNIIYKLTGPIAVVMYPELSKYIANNNTKRAFKLVRRVVTTSLWVGSFFIMVQFVFFRFWSNYIFEENASRIIVLLYFIYTVFCASVTSIHQIFTALNLVKYNIPIILTANIIYVIMTPLLMKEIGLIGLIISLIIQAFIVISCKVFIIEKRKNEYCNSFL